MNNKTDSRVKMIEAASKLFQLQGYHATGLNEILRESQSPKGSLYYYFPDGKEELAHSAIELACNIIQSKIKASLSSSSDPIAAIKKVIEDMKIAIDKDGKLQDVSLSLLALETYTSSELLREACKKSFISLENIYAEKLVESRFNPENAQNLGRTIEAMIEGAITISVTKKDTTILDTVSEQIGVIINHYKPK